MATEQRNSITRHLRRAVLLHDGNGMSDGQLLECFLTRKEEAAFEALVRRHGPMVLGVCCRMLRNTHDAEDAFQATFLVLIRKAGALLPRETLGNWLYGVAYRTALKARATIMKRRAKEAEVRAMPRSHALTEEDRQDLQGLLDRELGRLPAKYRESIVLCELEGKSRKEAARQLGIPEGTLSGRLTTARRKLAKRLAPYGLPLSGGVAATVLAQNEASAGVPASLAASTVKAATCVAAGQGMAFGGIAAQVAALTEGVLKAMLLTKLKIVMVVSLAVGTVGLGAGVSAYRVLAGQQERQKQESTPSGGAERAGTSRSAQAAPRTEKEDRLTKQALKELQGTWQMVSAKKNDRDVTDTEQLRQIHVSDDIGIVVDMVLKNPKRWFPISAKHKLDPSQKPATIDLIIPEIIENLVWATGKPRPDPKWTVRRGLYLVEREKKGNELKLNQKGDKLTLCLAGPNMERPTEFSAKPNRDWTLFEFVRTATEGPKIAAPIAAKPDQPPNAEGKTEPPFAAEFAKLKAATDKLAKDSMKGYSEAKTEEEKEAFEEKASATYNREGARLAEKALALVKPHAQDPAAVEVLTWILNYHSSSPAAIQAADLLIQHHLTDPKTQDTASRFVQAPMPWAEKLLRALAAADLPREKKGQALFQLAQCLKAKAAVPGLLKGLDARTVKTFELRFGKDYTAELRSTDTAKLEAEATRLFTEVADKYGDEKYGRKKLGDYARSALFEMQNLSVGKTAPEISGEDIDGQKFKLSDYRGKVIVLDFWGHW